MSKVSFGFFDGIHTQRDSITAAVALIKSSTLVYLNGKVPVVLANDTDYTTIDDIYIVAEDIKVGDVHAVLYPIRSEHLLTGWFESENVNIIEASSVGVDGGVFKPLTHNKFKIIKFLRDKKVIDTKNVTCVEDATAEIAAGTRVKLNASTSKPEASETGPYILAEKYNKSGTKIVVNVYSAPVAVEVL